MINEKTILLATRDSLFITIIFLLAFAILFTSAFKEPKIGLPIILLVFISTIIGFLIKHSFGGKRKR